MKLKLLEHSTKNKFNLKNIKLSKLKHSKLPEVKDPKLAFLYRDLNKNNNSGSLFSDFADSLSEGFNAVKDLVKEKSESITETATRTEERQVSRTSYRETSYYDDVEKSENLLWKGTKKVFSFLGNVVAGVTLGAVFLAWEGTKVLGKVAAVVTVGAVYLSWKATKVAFSLLGKVADVAVAGTINIAQASGEFIRDKYEDYQYNKEVKKQKKIEELKRQEKIREIEKQKKLEELRRQEKIREVEKQKKLEQKNLELKNQIENKNVIVSYELQKLQEDFDTLLRNYKRICTDSDLLNKISYFDNYKTFSLSQLKKSYDLLIDKTFELRRIKEQSKTKEIAKTQDKNVELNKLRALYKDKLNQYLDLVNSNYKSPDISHLKEYMSLNLKELESKYKMLVAHLDFQKEIVAIKDSFINDGKNCVNEKENLVLKNYNLFDFRSYSKERNKESLKDDYIAIWTENRAILDKKIENVASIQVKLFSNLSKRIKQLSQLQGSNFEFYKDKIQNFDSIPNNVKNDALKMLLANLSRNNFEFIYTQCIKLYKNSEDKYLKQISFIKEYLNKDMVEHYKNSLPKFTAFYDNWQKVTDWINDLDNMETKNKLIKQFEKFEHLEK